MSIVSDVLEYVISENKYLSLGTILCSMCLAFTVQFDRQFLTLNRKSVVM